MGRYGNHGNGGNVVVPFILRGFVLFRNEPFFVQVTHATVTFFTISAIFSVVVVFPNANTYKLE